METEEITEATPLTKDEMLLNEKTSQNANSAGAVQVTVNTFKPAENKGILSHLGRIFKNDIVGFFSEVRNIIRQTEGLEAYATCKQSGVCSDAIEEYHVHIPPMYDEILTDKPVAPTPGAATLDALTSVAQAAGSNLDDTGKPSSELPWRPNQVRCKPSTGAHVRPG